MVCSTSNGQLSRLVKSNMTRVGVACFICVCVNNYLVNIGCLCKVQDREKVDFKMGRGDKSDFCRQKKGQIVNLEERCTKSVRLVDEGISRCRMPLTGWQLEVSPILQKDGEDENSEAFDAMEEKFPLAWVVVKSALPKIKRDQVEVIDFVGLGRCLCAERF